MPQQGSRLLPQHRQQALTVNKNLFTAEARCNGNGRRPARYVAASNRYETISVQKGKQNGGRTAATGNTDGARAVWRTAPGRRQRAGAKAPAEGQRWGQRVVHSRRRTSTPNSEVPCQHRYVVVSRPPPRTSDTQRYHQPRESRQTNRPHNVRSGNARLMRSRCGGR